MSKIKWLVLFIIIASGTIFLFRNTLLDIYSRMAFSLEKGIEIQIEKRIVDFLEEVEIEKEVEKEVSIPPPLRAEKEVPEAFLTQAGVVEWTNLQRAQYGFLPLKENEKLNASARLKLEDMFEEQYFGHISPSGKELKDLIEKADYEFIAIGENLALGNFQNDQILVQAWMDSPGHQENILSPRYQEIGVAVSKGMFNGKPTWLAVQHFGLPLAACPQPEQTLKTKIEQNQKEIEELAEEIEILEAEIHARRPRRQPFDEQKLEEYNNLILQYNALIEETKNLINQYNNQVELFNQCISQIQTE